MAYQFAQGVLRSRNTLRAFGEAGDSVQHTQRVERCRLVICCLPTGHNIFPRS